jgi:N-acetylneuraminate synthase
LNKVIIIAEAGVNHNGDADLAFQLVDAAVEAGADIIKFQTFKAEALVTESAIKAEYQLQSGGKNQSQLQMLKGLELSHDMHFKLIEYCSLKKIQFLSTAFDLESLNFLSNNLSLEVLKISSGEITNGPLLLAHAKINCDLIISTGMATIEEIETALGVIAFGMLGQNDLPSKAAFKEAYSSVKGQKILKERVTLLHCTSEYPTPLGDINLRAMNTMAKMYRLDVGYSDHSEGIIVPIAAASLGAKIIEKHFTLDNTLPGPDHKASLEPDMLKEMVVAIRSVEALLGDGVKSPRPSELANRDVVRKSIVASKNISKGEIFSIDNITIKRPGSGRSPMNYWSILGDECDRDYQPEDIIF